jgi:hypothetical protein
VRYKLTTNADICAMAPILAAIYDGLLQRFSVCPSGTQPDGFFSIEQTGSSRRGPATP